MAISFNFTRRHEDTRQTPNPFELVEPKAAEERQFYQEVPEGEPVDEPQDEPAVEPETDGPMVLRTDNLVKKYGKRTVANHV